MIHKAYLAKKNGTPFEIWGTGSPLRQNIYSLDLARLLIWAVREYQDLEPLILATDQTDEKSINDWASMVLGSMDYQPEIKHLTEKSDGQFRKTATNARLRKYLPDFTFTPAEVAIKETVQWFEKHYEELRK